jgi:flagellar motor switch protein FliN/FliY
MTKESKNTQSLEDELIQNNQDINQTDSQDTNQILDNGKIEDNNDINLEPIKENSLNLLKDVPLKVVVELGRTVLKINELIELGVGSIIELNKLYGDPVDIYINNKMIARGEVVVIDEDFAVRITEIITNS